MTENPEFWQQQRFDRLTAPDRQPFAIGYVSSPSGGFAYVRDEILADPDAIGSLSTDNQALVSPVPGTQAWLTGANLVQYRFSGPPEDLLRFVAEWRLAARSAYATSRVDLHYVLTGEMKSTVPRGGPAGAPSLVSSHSSPTSWGEGPPVVAVLDTGLDPASAAAVLQPGAAGVPEPRVLYDPKRDTDVLGSHPPVVGQVTELLCEAGHGTFIASLIAAYAGDGVRIAALRVLDPDGIGTEQSVVEGLRRLREDFVGTYGGAVKVVNLSLGGFTDDGGWLQDPVDQHHLYPPPLRNQMPLGLAAELARWTGEVLGDTVFVAAAGNDGIVGRPFWPAALAGAPQPEHPVVVAVGSLTASLTASSFTNRDSWVVVSTIGEDLVSDYPAGRYRLGPQETETFDGRGASWSGTSFAAPLVSAEIAKRAQYPGPSGAGAVNAVPMLTGRAAWESLEREVRDRPAPDEGLGGIWDPRPVVPKHAPPA
jgi:hypothetical protein